VTSVSTGGLRSLRQCREVSQRRSGDPGSPLGRGWAEVDACSFRERCSPDDVGRGFDAYAGWRSTARRESKTRRSGRLPRPQRVPVPGGRVGSEPARWRCAGGALVLGVPGFRAGRRTRIPRRASWGGSPVSSVLISEVFGGLVAADGATSSQVAVAGRDEGHHEDCAVDFGDHQPVGGWFGGGQNIGSEAQTSWMSSMPRRGCLNGWVA
jgi:hypothetical protein